MSIFDMFKTSAPAAPTNTEEPGNSAAANKTVPTTEELPPKPAGEADKSPLAGFEKLWENDGTKNVVEPFKLDANIDDLFKTAAQVDFRKVLDEDLVKRITAGGEDSVKAMMEGMNKMSQLTFAQSSHAASGIVEMALNKQEERFKAMLPDIIRQNNVADTLQSNPLAKDPAVAPLIGALKQQVALKYPDATTAEIESKVNDYINGLGSAITAVKTPKDSKQQKGTDWLEYMTKDSRL